MDTVDTHYVRPGFAAAFLIRGAGTGPVGAWVETGTAPHVPQLLGHARSAGLQPADVRWIIVTHAHLDHAGGCAKLAHAYPQARVYAHPRATRHLTDPSKLEGAARAVYTDAVFEKLYGPKLEPVPAERVTALEEGARLEMGSLGSFEVWHTGGHARHHLCLIDRRREAIFTGDAFGLCYPALQRSGLFIFPSTSPTDFDAAEARASIRRVAASGLKSAYLTHYGTVRGLSDAASELLAWVDRSEEVMERCRNVESGPKLQAACEAVLKAHFEREIARRGMPSGRETWEWLELDLRLNAQGLAWAVEKGRNPSS